MSETFPLRFGSLVETPDGVFGEVVRTNEWRGEFLVGVEPVGEPGRVVWAQADEVFVPALALAA